MKCFASKITYRLFARFSIQTIQTLKLVFASALQNTTKIYHTKHSHTITQGESLIASIMKPVTTLNPSVLLQGNFSMLHCCSYNEANPINNYWILQSFFPTSISRLFTKHPHPVSPNQFLFIACLHRIRSITISH